VPPILLPPLDLPRTDFRQVTRHVLPEAVVVSSTAVPAIACSCNRVLDVLEHRKTLPPNQLVV
jgi:ABC-type microcin C transport system permease subunit YejE